MRRFSTSTAPATVARTTRWSPASLFQQAPVEELVELKTIKSVQRLAEQIPKRPAPKALLDSGDASHSYSGPALAAWLEQYQTDKQWTKASQMDKQAFEALVQDCVAFVKTVEDAAWQDAHPVGVLDESELAEDGTVSATAAAYIDAFNVKLAKAKCASAATYFESLDVDQDGLVSVEAVEELLTKLASGSTDAWLESQFDLLDTDRDGVVTETESQRILDAMVATQQAVLTEIFQLHVANLPKKHDKLLAKSMRETDWNAKIPEKVRCVFHFADKADDEGTRVAWDAFKASQEAELEELDRIIAVYAKGFYDERLAFYERKRDRRSTRVKGLMIATALAFGDYFTAII